MRRRGRSTAPRPVSLFSLFFLLSLTGCSVFQLSSPLKIRDGDWTTEGGTTSRANATDTDLQPPLERVWRYDADGAFGPAAAVIADETVIVVTRKGEVRAVSLDDGRRRSVGNFREPLEGAPVLTERVLYAVVASGKRTIIAHDFVKGQRLWALRVGPHEAGLLLTGGTLVAAGLDGTIRAIDPADGTLRWTATPDSAAAYFATPAATPSGFVLVADDRGRVRSLDLATGAVRWTADVGAPVYSTPAVANGRLFVPTTRGRFVALDAASGETLWETVAEGETGDEVRFSPPAATDGLVIVGTSGGRLRAFEAGSGAEVWSFLADGNFAAAPLIAGSTVYAGSLDEHIYALDRATGSHLWEHELDGRVKSTPLVHGETLIVLAEPRYVYAFTPAPPVALRPEDP